MGFIIGMSDAEPDPSPPAISLAIPNPITCMPRHPPCLEPTPPWSGSPSLLLISLRVNSPPLGGEWNLNPEDTPLLAAGELHSRASNRLEQRALFPSIFPQTDLSARTECTFKNGWTMLSA